METHKQCSICKENKNIEEFSWRSKRNNKRSSECKICHREQRRKHYLNNRDKIIVEANNRKNKIKKWFEDYKKTISCEVCGESHPATLQFHHFDHNEKETEISKAVHNYSWSIEKIKQELKKCKIVCANCHCKIHWTEKYNS